MGWGQNLWIVPFRARYQGDVVVPVMVPDGETVECLDCGGSLYQRGGSERAQHFYHPPGEESECCLVQDSALGESETHARCVALAVDALTDAFDGQYVRCQPELSLDVSGTVSEPDRRRADALLEFMEDNPVFGRGVILEVQHKHHTKDVEGTTHDYLSMGYSVAWLDTDEFDQDHLDYRLVDEKFRDDDSAGYAVCDHDAREFDPTVRSAFDWEVDTRGCWYYRDYDTHAWFRVPAYAHPQGREYEACAYCDARRQYDDSLTRFVYDYNGVLAPEFNTENLRDAYIDMPTDGFTFEEWVTGEGRYSDLTLFEDALRHGSVAPCRGGPNLHVWRFPQEIGDDEGTLWECKNCPVRLLAKKRGERFILFGDWPHPSWSLTALEGNPWRCTHRCHTGNTWYDMNACPDCHAPLPIDGG
jgi:hypothetical protein